MSKPRLKRTLRRPLAIGIAIGVGAAILAIGISVASIPDSSGVIHGCYKTAGKNHALTVIDSAVTATCPKGYTSLNWNQTGPQGPPGNPGYLTNRVDIPVTSGPLDDPLLTISGYGTMDVTLCSGNAGNGIPAEAEVAFTNTSGQDEIIDGAGFSTEDLPAGASMTDVDEMGNGLTTFTVGSFNASTPGVATVFLGSSGIGTGAANGPACQFMVEAQQPS